MRNLLPTNVLLLHFFVAEEMKSREMKKKQPEPCFVHVMVSK
jgi:hypothetical protein